MNAKQPGPRRPKFAVREALARWVQTLRTAVTRKRATFVLGPLLVAALIALGASPSRAVTLSPSSGTSAMPPPASAGAVPSVSAALDASTTPPMPVAQPPPSPQPLSNDPASVCINDANPEALRRLPGVGEKRAKAIIELRTRLGKLKRPEDLLRVKGLGRKRLAKMRPLLRFSCEPPPGPAQ